LKKSLHGRFHKRPTREKKRTVSKRDHQKKRQLFAPESRKGKIEGDSIKLERGPPNLEKGKKIEEGSVDRVFTRGDCINFRLNALRREGGERREESEEKEIASALVNRNPCCKAILGRKTSLN